MTTVHLVYPHGPRISCPDAIGRHLGRRLEQHYAVVYHNWDEPGVIRPQPGDVLLGHPHPHPWTCFRQSLSQPGWGRKLALFPYYHGNRVAVAFADSFLEKCDLYLAITGPYWFSSIDTSPFAHWRPKMVHVDLGVDRREYPVVKNAFNPPGKRRFVYIGHSGWTKNTGYLGQIASAMPETEIAWIGHRVNPIPGVAHLGYQDFAMATSREQVAAFDFMITVGKADANPSTILEAMAWGLIPVCTPQSGYGSQPGMVSIPLDNVAEAIAVLRSLQHKSEASLRQMQEANWHALDTHFNWDRFTRQVVDAIQSDSRPALAPSSTVHRLGLRLNALISPHAPWRPGNLARWLIEAGRKSGLLHAPGGPPRGRQA